MRMGTTKDEEALTAERSRMLQLKDTRGTAVIPGLPPGAGTPREMLFQPLGSPATWAATG